MSYERKHNQANGEENRDGAEHNLSRNWGVEGPTDDESVCALRRRAKRNLLASLALSAGVPMLGHGDELGRTQHGNNNAYCHDSELTWVDWDLDDERRALLAFTAEALRLRRELGLFDRRRFFSASELAWLHPDGREVTEGDWHDPELRTLLALLPGGGGQRLLLVLHAGDGERTVAAPAGAWRLRLATAPGAERRADGLRIAAYSLAVWTDEASSGEPPASDAAGSPPAAASAP